MLETEKEFFDMIVGKKIGEGYSRSVYEHNYDERLVIKIEKDEKIFQNVSEWFNWNKAKGIKKAAKWLVPCFDISANGRILISRRALPICKSKLPRGVPKFLADVKVNNWGLYEGRPVCLDYALMHFDLNLLERCVKWD